MNPSHRPPLQRSASNPDLRLALAENALPSFFEDNERAPLLQWLDEAPSIRELESRSEAVRRLLENSRRREAELNLSGLSLTSLPPSLAAARWLRRLDLAHNQLTELPDFLVRIPNLVLIDLTCNQVTQLTDNLSSFSPNCLINLEGNPVTAPTSNSPGCPQVMTDLPVSPRRHLFADPQTSRQESAVADGPVSNEVLTQLMEINRSREEDQSGDRLADTALDRLTKKFAHQIGEVIKLWRAQAGGFGALLPPLTPALWTELRCTRHAGSFALWLARLRETSDHQHERLRAPLQRRVLRVLEAVFTDQASREIYFALAHDAIETCGDRLALGLTQMEMALINLKAERGDLDADTLFDLGATQYCMSEIHRIALDYAEQQDAPTDPVEIELAFQVGLRERLNLPIGNHSMLYASTADLDVEDLDDAEARIRSGREHSTQDALDHLDALDQHEALLGGPAGQHIEHITEKILNTPDPHPLAHFLAAHYRPWGQQVERNYAQAVETLRNNMYACLDDLSARTVQHLISEADYRQACDHAMFFANHGVAYRRALEHIRNQPR